MTWCDVVTTSCLYSLLPLFSERCSNLVPRCRSCCDAAMPRLSRIRHRQGRFFFWACGCRTHLKHLAGCSSCKNRCNSCKLCPRQVDYNHRPRRLGSALQSDENSIGYLSASGHPAGFSWAWHVRLYRHQHHISPNTSSAISTSSRYALTAAPFYSPSTRRRNSIASSMARSTTQSSSNSNSSNNSNQSNISNNSNKSNNCNNGNKSSSLDHTSKSTLQTRHPPPSRTSLETLAGQKSQTVFKTPTSRRS